MDHSPQRRWFLRTLATLIDGAVALGVAIPGLRFFVEPLYHRREGRGFVRVTPLDGVPESRPIRMVVTADRYDAYIHYPPGPIGQVWLIRNADAGGEPSVRCFQTICPHLGCGIDLVPDDNGFACPCHASGFDADGRRRFGPSPRDMDKLECRVSPPDENGRRWIEVRYQRFQTGVADRCVIG